MFCRIALKALKVSYSDVGEVLNIDLMDLVPSLLTLQKKKEVWGISEGQTLDGAPVWVLWGVEVSNRQADGQTDPGSEGRSQFMHQIKTNE